MSKVMIWKTNKLIFLISIIILINFNVNSNSLTKSISEGLIISKKLNLAKQDYIISKQAIQKAGISSDLSGTLELSNSLVHNDKSTKSDFVSDEINTGSIKFSKRIFDSGEKNSKLDLAFINVEKYKAIYFQIEQEVIIEIINSHLNLINAIERAKLNSTNYKRLEEQNFAEKIKFDSGASTSTRLAELSAMLAKANSNKIISDSRLIDAKETFSSITGIKDFQLSLPELPKDLPKNILIAEEFAKKHHPEIISSNYLLKANKFESDILDSSILPKVDLSFSASQTRRDGDSFDKDELIAKIEFKTPLWVTNSTRATYKELSAKRSKAKMSYLENIRKIMLNARISFRKFESSNIHLISVQKELESAEILFENTSLETELGIKTYLDKLDKEQELFDVKLKLINAKNDVILNSFLLLKSLGKLSSDYFDNIGYIEKLDDLPEPEGKYQYFSPFSVNSNSTNKDEIIPLDKNFNKSLNQNKSLTNQEVEKKIEKLNINPFKIKTVSGGFPKKSNENSEQIESVVKFTYEVSTGS